MRIIDNVNELLGDDLKSEMIRGSKLRIAATTFSISSMQLKRAESAKIECARKFFESLNTKNGHAVKYDVVTDYSTLMSLVGQP